MFISIPFECFLQAQFTALDAGEQFDRQRLVAAFAAGEGVERFLDLCGFKTVFVLVPLGPEGPQKSPFCPSPPTAGPGPGYF